MAKISCLYCHQQQKIEPNIAVQNCRNCGMPLPKDNVKQQKTTKFVWWFWLVTAFCLWMVFFLPR